MSEFSPAKPVANPLVRMRFERYVFIAFFAVIAMVYVSGIVRFRKGQEDLARASQELDETAAALRISSARLESARALAAQEQSEALERQRSADARDARRSRELALALTQLALADAGGNAAAKARGRALLEDARRYGAAPYFDLARWALLDTSRAQIPAIAPAPSTCAAVSADGRWLALGRGERGVDLYDLTGEFKPVTVANPPGSGEAQALAVSSSHLFVGYRAGQLARAALPRVDGGDVAAAVFAGMRVAVRQLSLSPSGSRLAACDADGRLRVCSTAAADVSLRDSKAETEVKALLALDGTELCATLERSGVFTVYSAKESRAAPPLPSQVENAALVCLGAEVAGVARLRSGVAYVSGSLRDVTLSERFSINLVLTKSCLGMAQDGTALIGEGNRVYECPPSGELEAPYSLGSEAPVSFVARAGNCSLGLSLDGTLSMRRIESFHWRGTRIAFLPPDTTAIPTGHGFALAARGIVWSSGCGCFFDAGHSVALLPTSRGFFATTEGAARFSTGAMINGAFTPLCMLASGNAMVQSGRKLFVHSADGASAAVAGVELGEEGAVEAVSAAAANAALIREGGRLRLIVQEAGQIRASEVSGGGSGPLALDAHATRYATWRTGFVEITPLSSEQPELRIALESEPRSFALLYEGSVLCVLEGQSLAFFETQTGRELLRKSCNATKFAASDDTLFFVYPAELRVLKLK